MWWYWYFCCFVPTTDFDSAWRYRCMLSRLFVRILRESFTLSLSVKTTWMKRDDLALWNAQCDGKKPTLNCEGSKTLLLLVTDDTSEDSAWSDCNAIIPWPGQDYACASGGQWYFCLRWTCIFAVSLLQHILIWLCETGCMFSRLWWASWVYFIISSLMKELACKSARPLSV